VPAFLFEPIKQFMITNPDDDEFVIECYTPGSDITSPFGVVTCSSTFAVTSPIEADVSTLLRRFGRRLFGRYQP
jgi:hypothetical protein